MSEAVPVARRLRRAQRIGATFGRVYLGIKANQLLAARLGRERMARRWSRTNRSGAEAIYAAALDLRGLILKGCQFLGARGDVLPPEYVEVLSRLQDRVPPRPFRDVRATVERELGRPMESEFRHFARRPVASASLAQVHEAVRRDGRRVAVKVQYPEIEALVHGDLASLRALFRAVGVVERDFDLMPLVEELGRYVPRELDFVNEARNARTVAAQLAHRGDVRVPGIHDDLTTRRVLVMDFVEGIKISDVAGLRRAGVDPAAVTRLLMECFAEQILVHGFFHADPHPGNLLVEPDGPRLVLLDFGLSKDLPPHFRRGVLAFAAALLREDPDGMAGALVDLGFETREGRAGQTGSLAAVARIVLETGRDLRRQGFLDRRHALRAGHAIQEAVRLDPIVRIPSHLVLVGRVLGLLSGVGRALEAEVDWLRILLPYAFGGFPGGPPRAGAEAPTA